MLILRSRRYRPDAYGQLQSYFHLGRLSRFVAHSLGHFGTSMPFQGGAIIPLAGGSLDSLDSLRPSSVEVQSLLPFDINLQLFTEHLLLVVRRPKQVDVKHDEVPEEALRE